MLRKAFLAMAALLAMALVLAACGGGDSSTGGGESTAAEESATAEEAAGGEGGEASEGGNSGVKVGLALTGTKNDHGFYQLEYEGFKEAEEEQGFEGTVLEGLASPEEELDAMKNLSLENELVIGGGAEYADAAETLSAQFPDVQYAIVTGDIPKGIENVHGYTPRQGVPAYVGGAAAAAASTSEHLGFIGGLEIPPTKAAEEGFAAGAESITPGIEISSTVVGSFSDPAKGKEAAKAQVASGADQIFSFLDAGTVGVEQAVAESGEEVGIQNPDGQRCDVFEDSFGATVLGLNYVVDTILSDFETESMPDGTKYWGVEDPKIQRFELCPKYQEDPKLAKVVKETTEKLNNEEVQLPDSV